MKFVRAIWKLLVGIKDALVLLLMLLFFGALYSGLSARPAAVKDGVLDLNLNGSVVEQPSRASWSDVASGDRLGEYRLRDLVQALDKARDDSRVKAVALDLDGFTGGGQTAIGDLADAVRRVRAAGKPVIAYGDRLYQRQLPTRRGGLGNLVEPARRGADRRPGRKRPLFQGTARQARGHRERLSGRHLQGRGRAVHPQRHVARSQAERDGARPGRARQLANEREAGTAQGECRSVPVEPQWRGCGIGRRHGQGRARGRPGRPGRKPPRI